MGTLSPFPTLGRPTRVRYGVLAFASSLSLLTYLDRICIMRAKENMQGDLGFSDVEMGWVFSAFTVGYTIFEVPGGWMGDVWGSRRVLTRIVLSWSLFTALTGCVWGFSGAVAPMLLNSLSVMLLIRFLFGVGAAGAYPNLTRVVGDWFPFHERAFAQGAVWMSARLGGALAPALIGRLSEALGWRPAFWVLGGVGVVWCVLFSLWFRDRPQQMPSCNQAERDLIGGGSGHGGGHRLPPLPDLLRGVLSCWALCGASFFVCFGWYFFSTWQPQYYKDVFGLTFEDSEYLTGLPFLCGAAGALVGGRLSDALVRRGGRRRWGRSLIGIVGFTGAGLCVATAGFTRQTWQAVVLLCTASLVNDLAIPVIWAACTDVGGRYAGMVSGLMNTVGGVGAVLSPVLIPHVLRVLPPGYGSAERWRFILLGLACSWFLGAACWVFIDASRTLFPAETAAPPP